MSSYKKKCSSELNFQPSFVMHRFKQEQIKSLAVHKTYKLGSQHIYIQKRAKTIKQFKRRVC